MQGDQHAFGHCRAMGAPVFPRHHMSVRFRAHRLHFPVDGTSRRRPHTADVHLLPASVRHGRHRFPGATCRTGHIPFPWNINLLQLRKMVSTRNHHLLKIRLNATTKRMVIRNLPAKTFKQTLKKAPKPALLALAGLILLSICFVMFAGGIERTLIVPLLLGLVGIGVSWLRFNAEEGQLWTMLGGIAIIFAAYALYVSSCIHFDAFSMIRILCAGLALLIGVLLAIVPWIMALIRDLGTERASKEREEERADMTAHLHDGVLQTLALIQLHADDQQTVFSLARSQERELREWLYQERTTSDRSVNAGLKEIAAHVEDTHGKPIEVVTVGDARPSAQTDALLDATQQALINAVAHGGEPISVYCEASSKLVEVFVRDHGNGFDVNAIPANRLGIRESIIGRIKRRGGTVEIVSRPQWGTEVRMHMPIADMPTSATTAADANAQQSHEPQSNSQQTDFPNHHNRQSNNQRTNQFSNQPTNHFEEQQ